MSGSVVTARASGPFQTIDEAYISVLSDVVSLGHNTVVEGGKSIGVGQGVNELLGYSFTIVDARSRVLANRSRALGLVGAVGRLAWMLGGSDRLADIEFYQPRVAEFSDDGLIVPGSSYGKRLISPSPGIDQLEKVSRLVREEPGTRRAAAPIYFPEDTGRDSKDIPCAFGIFLNPRGDQLHFNAVFRSNNAWTLLPYNVFEFSTLAEIIAVEANLHLGTYTHFANSMHVYESNLEAATMAIASPPRVYPPMPPMPAKGARASATELAKFDIQLRSANSGLTNEQVPAWVDRAMQLGPYWADLGLALILYCLSKDGRTYDAAPVVAAMDPWYQSVLTPAPYTVHEPRWRTTLALWREEQARLDLVAYEHTEIEDYLAESLELEDLTGGKLREVTSLADVGTVNLRLLLRDYLRRHPGPSRALTEAVQAARLSADTEPDVIYSRAASFVTEGMRNSSVASIPADLLLELVFGFPSSA
jgi:thymidylate synthase